MQYPSQIKIEYNESSSYPDLYDSTLTAVTNKTIDEARSSVLTLNSSLTLNLNYNYHVGQEITVDDLEKKTVNGPLPATVRLLHAIAKKDY